MILGIVSNPNGRSLSSVVAKIEAGVQEAMNVTKQVQQYPNDYRNPMRLLRVLGEVQREMETLREMTQTGPAVRKNGRKGSREQMSEHVLAILYRHVDDDGLYCHGFADAEIDLTTHRDGSVTIGNLAEDTDVGMFAKDDGSIVIEGARGQRLWEDIR